MSFVECRFLFHNLLCQKNNLNNTNIVSNSLDSDKARRFVGPLQQSARVAAKSVFLCDVFVFLYYYIRSNRN